jgi:hypothetical protein
MIFSDVIRIENQVSQIIPLIIFLVLFWVAIPLASQELRQRGWSDKSLQNTCLALYFGSILVAMLVLNFI